jgi:hypothetical protein
VSQECATCSRDRTIDEEVAADEQNAMPVALEMPQPLMDTRPKSSAAKNARAQVMT